MADEKPSEQLFAKGTIRLRIPNLTELTFADENEDAFKIVAPSETKNIGGLDWRFVAYKKKKTDGLPKLDLHIYCNENCAEELWLAKVKFSTRTKIMDDPNNVKPCNFDYFYGFNTYYWILLDVYEAPADEIGPIVVELDVLIARVAKNGLPHLDATLTINYQKMDLETKNMKSYTDALAVNEHSLASMSSYFRNMFFEKKRESLDDNIYVISEDAVDFDIEAFRFMIYAAMTMGWAVNESNFMDFDLAKNIIKLSMKYDVPPLGEYCKEYLLKNKQQHSGMHLLEVADKCNFEALKAKCLAQISIFDFMEDFERNQQIYAGLSEGTRKKLKERMGKLGTDLRVKYSYFCRDVRALSSCQEKATQNGLGILPPMKHANVTDSYNKLAKVIFGTRSRMI